MLKDDANVDRSQRIEVLGTKVAGVAPTLVVFVRGQAMFEIRHCTPGELARLLDSALI
jgi:hypothetical protein